MILLEMIGGLCDNNPKIARRPFCIISTAPAIGRWSRSVRWSPERTQSKTPKDSRRHQISLINCPKRGIFLVSVAEMMKSGKGHHEEEEEVDEEFGAKMDAQPSINSKDGKKSNKANAIRSKHSVTEQRRRSKINERFQILRDLIPNTDQKRDTASFLLEVIEYVQYLQEKVQRYEEPYQGWSSEPTKLMPWRNSHWRVQSFVGHPQPIKSCSAPASTFPGGFDEGIPVSPNIQANPIEGDPSRDGLCNAMDQHPEMANKTMAIPMPVPGNTPIAARNDAAFSHPLRRPVSEAAHLTDCSVSGDALNQQEELTIEGGTISISSVYSHRLLNNLTQALQSTGVDLSHASISVQVDLGKRANGGLPPGKEIDKDHENPLAGNQAGEHIGDGFNGEDSDQAQKRMKI